MTPSPSVSQANALKAKMASGETVLGMWSIIPSPVVVEISALGGLDFLILDMEHGIFDVGALDGCIRACESGGAVPLVRLPGLNPSAAQWALDLGAHGIVVPQIRNAGEAATLVQMAKYAPLGNRGYNPFTRAALYANPPDNRSGKLGNDFSLTCAIVESAEAVEDLAGICATPHLDVVYVGVYDLSVALGAEGNTRDPRIVEVVERSIRVIRAAGKAAGMMVRSEADLARARGLGANFIVYSVDTSVLREAVSGLVAGFRSGEKK